MLHKRRRDYLKGKRFDGSRNSCWDPFIHSLVVPERLSILGEVEIDESNNSWDDTKLRSFIFSSGIYFKVVFLKFVFNIIYFYRTILDRIVLFESFYTTRYPHNII